MLWILALVVGALIPVQAAANHRAQPLHPRQRGRRGADVVRRGGATTLVAYHVTGGSQPAWEHFRAAPWWSYTVDSSSHSTC